VQLIETIAGKIANSFVGYLHLGSWLDVRAKSTLSGRGVRDFGSVEAFWRDVFEGAIHYGDRIRFKNAFLCEWFPRTPGAAWRIPCGHPVWTGERPPGDMSCFAEIREGKHCFIEWSSLDHYAPPPWGVVRLPFGTDTNAFCAMCLTTVDAWCCDLGIPVLASASVYEAFASRQQGANAVEADIEGIVEFRQIPLLEKALAGALGTQLDKDFMRSVVTPLGHPFTFLRVTSPLDVRMRTHNAMPLAFLWIISRQLVTHAVAAAPGGQEPPLVLVPVKPEWTYGFMVAPAQLNQPDSIERCVSCLRGADTAAFFTRKEPSMRPGVSRVEVLTEFDGRAPRFATAVPLRPRPWMESQELEKISLALQQLRECAFLEAKRHGDSQREDRALKQ